jgi:hypothetical protein
MQRLVAAKNKVITKMFTRRVVILVSLVLAHLLPVQVRVPAPARQKFLLDQTPVLNIMTVTVHVRHLGFVRFLSRMKTLTLFMKMVDYKTALVPLGLP